MVRCRRCSHPFATLSAEGLCWVCSWRAQDRRLVASGDEPLRKCERCGYTFEGLQEAVRCPECGLVPERPPARCRVCFYVVEGLTQEGPCPECGTGYDLSDVTTYTRRPPLLMWKLWLPGLLLAAGVGLAALLICVLHFGSVGAAAWFGAPLAGGAVLGYRVRAGTFVTVMLGIALFLMLVMGLVMFSLAGFFCALVLVGVFIAPITVGTVLGVGLRKIMKRTGFSQGSYLPVLVALLMPVVWGRLSVVERRPVERVSTEVVVDVPRERVWESLVFYEEVTHPPPWILEVGLARPLRTQGQARSVGDVKRCIYNKGPITKRLTAVEPGRRLAFEVIEQQIGYERDVRLVGGAFELEDAGAGKTRVRLVSEYEPKLGPRVAWRWGERIAFGTLHGYVIEGVRRKAGMAVE